MDTINKVKSISIWIFIVPFVAINTCLILITNFHEIFPNKEHIIHNTIPYIDGGASISRTARVFPTYLIFKPAMFLTAYLLIRYWLYIKKIILNIHGDHKNLGKILIFGIGSAICLVIHSIFLGIKFDYYLYKFFRRVIIMKIMAIGAHPDDIEIFMYGLLSIYKKEGHQVFTMIATDGSKGGIATGKELAQKRANESIKGLKKISLPVFLNSLSPI